MCMLVKKTYGSWDDVDDYWLDNSLIDCSNIKKLKKNILQYKQNNINGIRKDQYEFNNKRNDKTSKLDKHNTNKKNIYR